MKRQRYTAEFRQETVNLIIIDGTSAKEVSQQLEAEASGHGLGSVWFTIRPDGSLNQ